MQEHTPTSSPDGRRQRWVEHRRERRQEFVDAAVSAVRQHGPDTGLDEVAAQIGVSKSVVYRHFADREDLFGAVLDTIADDILMPAILGALGEAAQSSSELPVLDAETVRRVVRAYIAVVDDEPQLYRFALAHAASGVDGDFVASAERQIAQALSAVLGDRLRELGRDSGGADVWAFGVVGMVQLATQRWFEQRSMTADALADYLTTLATGGLSGLLSAS